MYLVFYYATISGHSRIKAAMLQLSNCTLSQSFYSSEAGCLNKPCLTQILVYLVHHLIPVLLGNGKLENFCRVLEQGRVPLLLS